MGNLFCSFGRLVPRDRTRLLRYGLARRGQRVCRAAPRRAATNTGNVHVVAPRIASAIPGIRRSEVERRPPSKLRAKAKIHTTLAVSLRDR